jgi:glucose-1-phosphate thymidylyltransferase
MVESDVRVSCHVTDAWWKFQPQPESLLAGNRLLLDRMELRTADCQPGRDRRVAVHPTASVEGSVLSGPTIIGPDARVTDSYVGPYTAVGAGARIEASEIEDSIVLPDAHVRDVGVRIRSSLIGTRARVLRDFALPRGMRVWLGSETEVGLA